MNKEIRLFYSWQSDKPEITLAIRRLLGKAKSELAKQGIDLKLDEGTRDTAGSPNIEQTVLKKIKECDVMVADVTPVAVSTEESGKTNLIPNPCVMFEAGYGTRELGEERMIFLASIEEDERPDNFPFDINHRRLSFIRKDTPLASWILKAMERISEREIELQKKQSCLLTFSDCKEFVKVEPVYEKIKFIEKREKLIEEKPVKKDNTLAAVIGRPFVEQINDYLRIPTVSLVQPKIGQDHDKSCCKISFEFYNNGSMMIKNPELFIYVDEPVNFVETDVVNKYGIHDLPLDPTSKAFRIYSDHIYWSKDSINPGRGSIIGETYVRIPYGTEKIDLKWEMYSAEFYREGTLTINVASYVGRNVEKIDSNKVGTEEIVPFIEFEELNKNNNNKNQTINL